MRAMTLQRMVPTLLALLVTGCAGPTTAGLDARGEARARMDRVSTRLASEQARQAWGVGQFDEALLDIDAALARSSETADYHLLRARILIEMHRLEEAQQGLDRTLSLDPGLAEAHYLLGIVHQRWSEDVIASTHYGRALALDETRAAYVLACAESLVAIGRSAEAVALVTARLGRFEHNVAFRQLLARIAMLAGDSDEAADLLGEARLMAPADTALAGELVRAQYAARRYGPCRDTLRWMRDVEPGSRPDLDQIEARCLVALDRPVEARDLYVRLSRQAPSDDAIWRELGRLSWDLSDWHRLAMCGRRLAALAPTGVEGHLFKAVGMFRLGDPRGAMQALEQASASPDRDASLDGLLESFRRRITARLEAGVRQDDPRTSLAGASRDVPGP